MANCDGLCTRPAARTNPGGQVLSGQPLDVFLAWRLFAPLGMAGMVMGRPVIITHPCIFSIQSHQGDTQGGA